jgi:hypothetical protein
MLDTLLKNQEKVEEKWPETGLPTLVDDIVGSYDAIGGMDHLEGKDLPSKKVVIEVLEDLFTVLFPGYLGKEAVTKANIKYFLGNTLTSIYTRLTNEVEKSLKYICRKITEWKFPRYERFSVETSKPPTAETQRRSALKK